MASHEYLTRAGNVTRRHHNGIRLGKPKPETVDLDALALKAYENGNSQHWHELAMKAADELVDLIGYEEYHEWADTIEDGSWKHLYELLLAELNRRQQDCDCNGANRSSCPVCSQVGVTEIPY